MWHHLAGGHLRLQIQPAQYSWKIVHTIHSLLRVATYDANLPGIGRYCFYRQIENFPPFISEKFVSFMIAFWICPQYCFKSTCESCDRINSETRPQYTSHILPLDLERALPTFLYPLEYSEQYSQFYSRTLSTTLVLLAFDYNVRLIHILMIFVAYVAQKIKILKVIADCKYQLGSFPAFHVGTIGKLLIPILFVTFNAIYWTIVLIR